jgi:PAS domain S-box-containing protein
MASQLLRLLLIEDSENDALLLMATIRLAGYELISERVFTAPALRQALETKTWDLIIADYKIPRFGAADALEIVREFGLDIPFIVVSGAIGESTAVEMMRAGAHDYLMKDNLLRLIPAIERELEDVKNRAERRRAQELSLRLGRIMDNSPNEIYLFNAKTLQVMQVNRGALQNSAYSWEELQSMTIFELSPALEPESFAELTEALYKEQQESIVCEMQLRRRDQSTYPAEVILNLLRSENPPVLLAIVQDISERKQAQEELMAFAQRLERSNQELQSFAHIASHDLQEPLRKVQMFSSRIEEKYGDLLDESGQQYIQRMQNAVNRMQAMITSLLKYARLSGMEAQQLELVDLNSVLQEVVGDLEVQIEQVGGKVYLDVLPIIPAYSMQMYQLFQNLISNALKYHRRDVPPVVRVYSEAAPRKLRIVVEDNGIGIPTESYDRIFGFFNRLHGRSEYEGNGIGLAICRKIMDNHAGSIQLESEEGKGTRFIVSLPVITAI